MINVIYDDQIVVGLDLGHGCECVLQLGIGLDEFDLHPVEDVGVDVHELRELVGVAEHFLLGADYEGLEVQIEVAVDLVESEGRLELFGPAHYADVVHNNLKFLTQR